MDDRQLKQVHENLKTPVPEVPRLGEILKQLPLLEPESKCKRCGLRPVAMNESTERSWCRVCARSCRLWNDRDLLWKEIEKHVPKLFLGATVDGLVAGLSEKLTSLGECKGFLLWGACGAGKTHALMSIAKQSIATGWTVKVVEYEDLCSRIRSTYQATADETEKDIIDSLVKVDRLFIDDIGTMVSGEKIETDFSRRVFCTILNQRLNHCRPTYITTNKPVESLTKTFGQRVGSRLQAACEIIQLTGKDRRTM